MSDSEISSGTGDVSSDENALIIQELCQELLYNKWIGFTIDKDEDAQSNYDYQLLKDAEERLYNLSLNRKDNQIQWYVRKFLFWLNQLTDNIDTHAPDIDFINEKFIGENDWDELFSQIYFGDLSKDVMDILLQLSMPFVSDYYEHKIYNIMFKRYDKYFPDSPETVKSIIHGILTYAWLVASEINLPAESEAFQTIIITKHNLILSSLENNMANDNLREKIASGIINPPEIVAFMSRQQLLPEFHGKRAQMILTRAEAEDAEIIDPEKMEDGFYECKKCGKRKTKHYEMQTRSADEPMTIFVICYLCHITWKAL